MPTARVFARFSVMAAVATVLMLSACGKPPVNYAEAPVDVIYEDALYDLNDKAYLSAAAKFAEVERQHPYSAWARRAILMSAYSNYMANRYSDAILATERFIGLHPGNKDVPYAYYLKAICY